VSPYGVGATTDAIVTEQVLKEAMVSLHYDEIPLIESAGKIRYTIANHLYDRNVRGLWKAARGKDHETT
jgi:hypothetical protein